MIPRLTHRSHPSHPSVRRRLAVAGLGVAALVAAPGTADAYAGAAATDTTTSTVSNSTTTTAKWRASFRDDFSGGSLNRSKWCVYNGPGNQHGPRSASNVSVNRGVLTLRTRKMNGRWYGSGVCAARATRQTYGRYQIKVRMERGFGVRAVALLWPAGTWPPEVDFYELESSDPRRTRNMLTNHYRPNNSMTHAFVKGDFTRWHVIGVEWTPGALRYTKDGRVVATMTHHVPHVPMWLGMQTGTGRPGGRNYPHYAGTVDMKVDWVQVDRLA